MAEAKVMLDPGDRTEIARIVGSLYEFVDGGPRGRRVLLQLAGLEIFVGGLDLSGDARLVAGDLVIRLEKHGRLEAQPEKHALGALLSYVITLRDLSPEDARYLAAIIIRYVLIVDPVYLDRLRSEYGITDIAADVRFPTDGPPARTKVIAPGPSFKVGLGDEDRLERVINSEDNFLDIYLLGGAMYSAQAVCRVERPLGTAVGTGFLIGPSLVLTNQHVLPCEDFLSGAYARFDYKVDATGVAGAGRAIPFKEKFYRCSPQKELDYAIAYVREEPLKDLVPANGCAGKSAVDLLLQGKHRGYLVLAGHFIAQNDRVGIVQHPDGDPLKVVLTQNYVVADMQKTRVHYVADTMNGSSGSPVFNRNWEVVALHHSGAPYPPDSLQGTLKRAWRGRFRVNEGVPVREILADFKKKGFEALLPKM